MCCGVSSFQWGSGNDVSPSHSGPEIHPALEFRILTVLTDHKDSFLSNSHLIPAEDITPLARDVIEANELWKLNEKTIGEKFGF